MPPRAPRRRNGRSPARIGASSALYGLQGPMELEQQLLGGLPVVARVGDGQAVLELAQIFRDGLVPRFQVTLEHESDDGAVAVHYLGDAVFRDERLQAVVLVGVA